LLIPVVLVYLSAERYAAGAVAFGNNSIPSFCQPESYCFADNIIVRRNDASEGFFKYKPDRSMLHANAFNPGSRTGSELTVTRTVTGALEHPFFEWSNDIWSTPR